MVLLFGMHFLPAAARTYCPVADVFISGVSDRDENESDDSGWVIGDDECCCRIVQTGKLTSATTSEHRSFIAILPIVATTSAISEYSVSVSSPNLFQRDRSLGFDDSPLLQTQRLRI